MYYIRLYVQQALTCCAPLRQPLIVASLLMIGSNLNVRSTSAQSADVQQGPEVSGLIFADYAYTVTSPNGTNDGQNGFDYRRAYVTLDYALSDRLDSRLRFEAQDSKTLDDGRPAFYVKDLWVRLRPFIASDHTVMFGLHPTPNFRLSEDVWGYRSLEATVQDRADIVASRDMGISFLGPINDGGTIRYRVMAANNNDIRAETDKYKRVYGAVEFHPESSFRAAIGADYYQLESVSSTNVYAFVGVETDMSSGGIELFSNALDRDAGPDPVRSGLSFFGSYSHTENRTFVGRLDLTGVGDERLSTDSGYVLIGYAFGMDDRLEIIPNVEYWFSDGSDDGLLRARFTISATL